MSGLSQGDVLLKSPRSWFPHTNAYLLTLIAVVSELTERKQMEKFLVAY